MKKTVFLSVLLWCSLSLFSQQSYYLFIQSDKNVPFYIRTNDTIFSSSSFGHLVISGLKDSTYTLFIGMAGNQNKESVFPVKIAGKDRGFDFKNLPADGWILFDWQSMEIIKSRNAGNPGGSSHSDPPRTDPFSKLMAGVVNDSSVLYKTVFRTAKETVPPAVKTETVKAEAERTAAQTISQEEVKRTDSITLASTPDNNTTAREIENKPESASINQREAIAGSTQNAIPDSGRAQVNDLVSNPELRLAYERRTEDNIERLYLDKSAGGMDSISILIPLAKDEVMQPDLKQAVNGNVQAENSNPLSGREAVLPAVIESDSVAQSSGIIMINSDCRNFATESDLDKLRVAILKSDKLEDKIIAAKKTFRNMCFTTRQIAALTELFATDEGRFLLFEAAYPFVSDSGNFRTLSTHLNDSFYITRFRVLTRA